MTLLLKRVPDSARGANRCKYYLHIQKVRFISVHFSDTAPELYSANYRLGNHMKKQMCMHVSEKGINVHVIEIFNTVSASLGKNAH